MAARVEVFGDSFCAEQTLRHNAGERFLADPRSPHQQEPMRKPSSPHRPAEHFDLSVMPAKSGPDHGKAESGWHLANGQSMGAILSSDSWRVNDSDGGVLHEGVAGDLGFAGIPKCLLIDPGGVREISRWLSGRETTGYGAMATGIPAGMRERRGELPAVPSLRDGFVARQYDRWTRCARPPAMIFHPFRMNSSLA
jgi:hypothetical protein